MIIIAPPALNCFLCRSDKIISNSYCLLTIYILFIRNKQVTIYSHICVLYTTGPPVFRTPLEPVIVPVGGVATFNCDVYSNPMLQSIRWIFSGVTIVSDGLRIMATDTQLIINSVQSEDEGSYSCIVTNPYGSLQSSAILTTGKCLLLHM